ncbi:aminotransferase class III-fold pyridoxal phosphate-dependent enzyme, partial [Mycolicibacterium austroafricanum]|uniref:aminotransferase class III-fold pyridoxal phosphate-dependent enzyme n=1 Tax=Mycolicibacterium austroafricanum TaxID=39687 RepID=UPI000D433FF4
TGAAGAGFDMAYLTSSGAESTECAMKLARKHTGRPKFVAFERGTPLLTPAHRQGAEGAPVVGPFEPLLDEVMFVPYDSLTAAAAAVDDRTAAVIVEPIQGEGGI